MTALALLLTGLRARAEPAEPEGPMHPAAQALYDRALAEFSARDYAGAIRDSEAGYTIDARRDFLFMEAQAKRLAGDCRGAVALYQQFLTTAPPQVQVDATHIALARCAQELASRPQVVVVAPPPPAPPARPRPQRWWRDPWGLSLSAVGLVALGAGVGWFVAAQVARSDAQGADSYADYSARWSTAESRRDVAVVAWIIGGAALVAAGVRLEIVRRHARAEAGAAKGLSLWLVPGGVGGTF
ncbi:MAG TPA: hypothetical protein VMT03_15905 [Polyangia bacterium]|nr:hypothetical protein [Polyangia bacterium]